MASLIDTWRIIRPQPNAKRYYYQDGVRPDGQGMPGDAAHSFMSYSWYSDILKSSASRIQKYMQYDAMDKDIDISRALDTIAEEISTKNNVNELPFDFQFHNEDGSEVTENFVTTLRASLRHWTDKQDLENRIFKIARSTIKYGDCFFQKTTDFKKWKFINPHDVLGMELDENGICVAYHIRKDIVDPKTVTIHLQTDVIPAEGIIHFTLSDDMGPEAPFGESVLAPIVTTFRQLAMLQDAAIIYRIVRAPERRIFYIDVGNMPAQRVKQYLESVKNDMRQRKVPNTNGDPSVDSTYNPQCLTLDTVIPLLDSRELTLRELILEHEQGKKNWVYSCDPITGAIVPGPITWAGITRKNTQVVKVTLDNGEIITCTPDHKFPVLGVGFVEAQHLTVDHSLVPFNKRWAANRNKDISDVVHDKLYEQIYDVSKKEWIPTHQMVASNSKLETKVHKIVEKLTTVHHVNFNKHDNNPTNLVLMGAKDHFSYHSAFNKERYDSWTIEKQEAQLQALKDGLRHKWDTEDLQSLSDFQDKRTAARNITNAANGKNACMRYIGIPQGVGQQFVISPEMKARMRELVKANTRIRKADFISLLQLDEKFMTLFKEKNKGTPSGRKSKPSYKFLQNFNHFEGYRSFVHFKAEASQSNHKICKVEFLEEKVDTGCITVEDSYGYHTFALKSGVFVKNSQSEDYFMPITANGRGSRIETLPGGQNLGENFEITFFQEKIFRGLRIPTSYMSGAQNGGATFNDGKVGVAFIEELRFANYVKRFQNKIEHVFDEQYKTYLNATGIRIDVETFALRLPDPQNFAIQRQAAQDSELIGTFSTADGIKYLSKQYIMKRFLGMTEDDIKENAMLLKSEQGITENGKISSDQQLYDPACFENKEPIKIEAEGESEEGSGDSGGGDEGMGDEGGMPPDDSPLGGDAGGDDSGGFPQ